MARKMSCMEEEKYNIWTVYLEVKVNSHHLAKCSGDGLLLFNGQLPYGEENSGSIFSRARVREGERIKEIGKGRKS